MTARAFRLTLTMLEPEAKEDGTTENHMGQEIAIGTSAGCEHEIMVYLCRILPSMVINALDSIEQAKKQLPPTGGTPNGTPPANLVA